MSEPFGGGSSVDPGSGDSGTFTSAPVESAGNTGGTPGGQVGSPTSGNAGNQNGAWNEALSQIPREFHPVLTPHLKKFESNYGQLAQQYAPWRKAFADKGTTPDELMAAHQLYQLVNQNPQLVYERLAAALGYQSQQQQFSQQQDSRQQYQQNGYQQNGYQPQDYQQQGYDPQQGMQQEYQQEQYDDPRLSAMAQQMQQMQQMFEQQQYQQQAAAQEYQKQQMTNQYEQQLDSGIKALLAKDPNFDVSDVLNRVYLQVSQDQEVDIQKAYNEHVAFVQKIRATPMNSASAPRVMPTGGGMPPTIDTTRPKTTAEKAARVQQLIQAAQQGQ